MTINEASQKYNITKDTIRYYEKIGLIPPIPRNKSGIRDFNEETCNWIEFIKCMRSSGLSIETLKEYVALSRQGEDTAEQRRNLLVIQRQELIEKFNSIKSTIERLDYKIENYDKILKNRK